MKQLVIVLETKEIICSIARTVSLALFPCAFGRQCLRALFAQIIQTNCVSGSQTIFFILVQYQKLIRASLFFFFFFFNSFFFLKKIAEVYRRVQFASQMSTRLQYFFSATRSDEYKCEHVIYFDCKLLQQKQTKQMDLIPIIFVHKLTPYHSHSRDRK